MTRLGLICLVTLAFLAFSFADPEPKRRGRGNMFGGMSKWMGKMMGGGGKRGKKSGFDLGAIFAKKKSKIPKFSLPNFDIGAKFAKIKNKIPNIDISQIKDRKSVV